MIKIKDDVPVIVAITIIFVTSLWLIDISVSAQNASLQLVGMIFRNVDPYFTYHLGLLLAIVAFMLGIFYAHFIFMRENNEKTPFLEVKK
jgi:hypothetical protein